MKSRWVRNHWSPKSQAILKTCREELVVVADAVLARFNCAAISGARTAEEQLELFRQGRSRLDGRTPATMSKHQVTAEEPLSRALDLAPWYPEEPHIPWEDVEIFRAFGGFVMGVAAEKGIELRWGGDWDGDWTFKDQRFHDLPHFELVRIE